MAKNTQYHCQQCGSVAPKWAGRCESCGAWNSIVEEQISSRPSPTSTAISSLAKNGATDHETIPKSTNVNSKVSIGKSLMKKN